MKKEGKYRFTLQFGADSEEQIQAGELLERLGNKKSAVIVAALNEYMASRPGLQDPHCEIEVRMGSGYDREKLEQMIRTLVEEKFAALEGQETSVKTTSEDSQEEMPEKGSMEVPERTMEILEEDVAQMLDNLDMFL